MTRTFNYIFPLANTWYNVWSDIISKDPSFKTKLVQTPTGNITVPDYQFDYGVFENANVKLFKYQAQNALVNPNNGGAVIFKSSGPSQELGVELLSGSWDSASTNTSSNISLKEQWFKSTVGGAGINVEVDF
jgi:hypothetical protein